MQTTTTPHPSRSAPLCKDCKHQGEDSPSPACNHPSTAIDLVRGHPLARASSMRDDKPNRCGPAAVWFERSPSARCTRCHGRGTEIAKVNGKAQKVACPECLTAVRAAATATTTSADTGSANRA